MDAPTLPPVRKMPARLVQMGLSSKALARDFAGPPSGNSYIDEHKASLPPPPAANTTASGKGPSSPFAAAANTAFEDFLPGPASSGTSMTHASSLMAPQVRKLLMSQPDSLGLGLGRASSLPNLLLANKLGNRLSAQLTGTRSPAEARMEAHEKAVNETIFKAERASLGSGSYRGSLPSMVSVNSSEFRRAFLASLPGDDSSADTTPLDSFRYMRLPTPPRLAPIMSSKVSNFTAASAPISERRAARRASQVLDTVVDFSPMGNEQGEFDDSKSHKSSAHPSMPSSPKEQHRQLAQKSSAPEPEALQSRPKPQGTLFGRLFACFSPGQPHSEAHSEVVRPVPAPPADSMAARLASKEQLASKAQSASAVPASKTGKAAADAAPSASLEGLPGKASSKLPVTVRTSDDPNDRASQEWRLKPGQEEVMVALMQDQRYLDKRLSGAMSLASTLPSPRPEGPTPLHATLSQLQAAHIARVPPSPWDADPPTIARCSAGEFAQRVSPLTSSDSGPSDVSLIRSIGSTDNEAGRGVRTFSSDPLEVRRTNSVPEPDPLRTGALLEPAYSALLGLQPIRQELAVSHSSPGHQTVGKPAQLSARLEELSKPRPPAKDPMKPGLGLNTSDRQGSLPVSRSTAGDDTVMQDDSGHSKRKRSAAGSRRSDAGLTSPRGGAVSESSVSKTQSNVLAQIMTAGRAASEAGQIERASSMASSDLSHEVQQQGRSSRASSKDHGRVTLAMRQAALIAQHAQAKSEPDSPAQPAKKPKAAPLPRVATLMQGSVMKLIAAVEARSNRSSPASSASSTPRTSVAAIAGSQASEALQPDMVSPPSSRRSSMAQSMQRGSSGTGEDMQGDQAGLTPRSRASSEALSVLQSQGSVSTRTSRFKVTMSETGGLTTASSGMPRQRASLGMGLQPQPSTGKPLAGRRFSAAGAHMSFEEWIAAQEAANQQGSQPAEGSSATQGQNHSQEPSQNNDATRQDSRMAILAGDAPSAGQAVDMSMCDAGDDAHSAATAGMLPEPHTTDVPTSPLQNMPEDANSHAKHDSPAMEQPSSVSKADPSHMAAIHGEPPARVSSQGKESANLLPAAISRKESINQDEQVVKTAPSLKTALQVYAEGFSSSSALGEKLGSLQRRTSQNGGHNSWKLGSHVRQRRTSEQSCTGSERAFEHADDSGSTIAV